MTALLKYDAAVAAVAEARTTDEVADWENQVAAMHEYARRIRDRSVEIDMAEIKARCRLRRGQILLNLRASGRLREGKPPKETVIDPGQLPPISLDDLKISRNESSECQRIAGIEGNAYERLVARCRAYMEENPNAHAIDVLRSDGAINGARSIMGSRQEPDDSLDYFPTPPWATRALIEVVLPHLQAAPINSVWEPACGEGHIAEVLREYVPVVHATDVFDYGYGELWDFLANQGHYPGGLAGVQWICTNPPFRDAALAFVEEAHRHAAIGVAMFFRSQWAVEGTERYERVFRDTPPTCCAFFVERVNLCKGRWDPDGSTATAYCWLIWGRSERPVPPFWIPPGQRKAMTRPDDAERFTAHPVIKRRPTLDGESFDPTTGELHPESLP